VAELADDGLLREDLLGAAQGNGPDCGDGVTTIHIYLLKLCLRRKNES
jgi:hypothetical protein